MPNAITLAQKYLPLLDEVYKRDALTSILDSANNKVQFNGGNTVKVFKTSMEGLGTYGRNTGYVQGSVTAGWEDFTLTQDRGRKFMIDVMDDEETLGMAFGTLAGEFLRTQVTPEIDAYRFAKYASTTGVGTETADITDSTKVTTLIDTGRQVMADKEVPIEGNILFVSEKTYAQLKNNIVRTTMNGENGINYNVETFDNMRVIRVPSGRFNTAITLNDGSTGGTEGGFKPTAGGSAINFMIIHPSAIIQVAKHVAPKIISPEVNQTADAYMFMYRIYHDCFVEDNKVDGIYVHKAKTANA